MGEVGSGAIGLAMAWLCAGAAVERPVSALAVLLPLSAFLVDAGLTLLRRMLRRERWWQPHSQHLYQALARRHGHTRVTLAYAAWTLLVTVLAVTIQYRARPFITTSVLMCYTTAALLWLMLQHQAATGCGARETRDP